MVEYCWEDFEELKSVIMTDKEHAPLTAACVRALVDKLYEKRKSAALEIER